MLAIPSRGQVESSDPRSLNVLLVDDSHVNRMLLKALLEKRQHGVTLATNGKEAVDAVRAKNFDVVLMDVEMPTMDGLEATRQIRALESSAGGHLPIIGVTTVERDICLDAGMDDHLPKTYQGRQLDAVLARHTLRHAHSS